MHYTSSRYRNAIEVRVVVPPDLDGKTKIRKILDDGQTSGIYAPGQAFSVPYRLCQHETEGIWCGLPVPEEQIALKVLGCVCYCPEHFAAFQARLKKTSTV